MPRGEALRWHFDDLDQQRAAVDLGMWTFLATEVLFFGAPLLVYLVGRFEFTAAFAAASAQLNTELGLGNTFVLLSSSLAMAYADAYAQRNQRQAAFRCLLATAALGVVFLAVKAYEYRAEYVEGLLPIPTGAMLAPRPPAQDAFFGFYLFLTALHAAHLVIGVCIVAFVAVRCRRGGERSALPAQISTTALYWHFVDIVWIFLFPWFYLVV